MFDLKIGLPMIEIWKEHPLGVYVLCGVLFALLLDIVNEALGSPEEFEWGHRAVIVALWPMFVIIFVVGLFRN